jgi:orotate phosphoribosyltransferase
MNYRSVGDLNDQIVRWVENLPIDIEVVVGIPRSGLLVANLLAMYLNLPMTHVEGLISGKLLQSGARFTGGSRETFLEKSRSVLVVDDSVSYGGQMARTKAEITQAGLPHRIHYGAVYITPEARNGGHVDHFCEVVPRPRVFEWNVMHHASMLKRACVEIDGVLARIPGMSMDAGQQRSQRLLENAVPLWRPRFELGWVVTSRPEQYRTVTEEWLARHGVRYTALLMMPSGENGGDELERCARFKAEAYVSTGASLLLEYSAELSCRVAALARRPVYCVQTRELIRPEAAFSQKRLPRSPMEHRMFNACHQVIRLTSNVYRRLTRLF